MKLSTPNQDKYKNKITLIQDLLREAFPSVSRSVGSVVYELLIRPIAVIYSSLEDAMHNIITDNSIKTLSTSSNTVPGVADTILSNYFITRNTGSKAASVLTVYSEKEFTKIPKGSVFTVDGVSLTSTETVCGVYPDARAYTSSDTISYVNAFKEGDLYCFNIQVQSVSNTLKVVPSGVAVDVSVYIPGVQYAILCSPLEGGSEYETDASMVDRARDMVCSWHGGSQAINKILKTSGLPVHSSSSFSADDPEMLRASGSPVYIGTRGMVDTYVKTCTYPLSGSDTLSYSELSQAHKSLPYGVLSIDSVVDSSGQPVDFSVSWGSSDSAISPDGARLSVYQTIRINVSNSYKDSKVRVSYTYMPYIKELQDYIDRPDVKLMGVGILIKAAIPAIVTIRGSVNLNNSTLEDIKESVKTYINNKKVGETYINVAEINDYIRSGYPGSFILSPVSLQATSMSMYGGISADTSISGLLVGSDNGLITSRVKFFCISDSGVALE